MQKKSSGHQQLFGSWCRKENTTSSNRKWLAHHKARAFENLESETWRERERERESDMGRERQTV